MTGICTGYEPRVTLPLPTAPSGADGGIEGTAFLVYNRRVNENNTCVRLNE